MMNGEHMSEFNLELFLITSSDGEGRSVRGAAGGVVSAARRRTAAHGAPCNYRPANCDRPEPRAPHPAPRTARTRAATSRTG
ncbi:hypothetical protein EVAR_33060_1 [Eumeta japonica]|uniref:Uncharacterized protein n=1 Tax=Eumeta variegata TaxID=151549 RepID=A0A4C1WTH7_EUMVA|nr:hypothetical protein EVAR_33060_1 [Eumeta japonica]